MEVYGLTGGIGSGKSTVATLLEDYGIPVVSADELSRMVVAPGSRGLADVVEAFGSEVLDDRGELDRKKMGRIVFTTPERRRQLEAILHPRIRERYEQVLDALEKAGHPVMVYEVPLLFEKKLEQQDEMKAVILVTATAETRIARVKARDSLTTDEVLSRMRSQMPEHEKRERANYVIHNDGDLDDLRREVEYLVSRFLRIAPRNEAGSTDDFIEEIEPEIELDESEIDTLSPEQSAARAQPDVPSVSHETETMPNTAAAHGVPAQAQAQPRLEVELQPLTPAVPSTPPIVGAPPVASPPSPTPSAPPPPATNSTPPVAAPPAPAPAAPAPAPAVPAPAPASAPASSAAWIPAGTKPAPNSTLGRNRPVTAPQLTIPPEVLAKPSNDGEEPSK